MSSLSRNALRLAAVREARGTTSGQARLPLVAVFVGSRHRRRRRAALLINSSSSPTALSSLVESSWSPEEVTGAASLEVKYTFALPSSPSTSRPLRASPAENSTIVITVCPLLI